jgi:Tol biopolymer transport system component
VFDPMKGTMREAAKLEETPSGWNWGLSPDGTLIAAVQIGATQHQIRLISLAGQPAREITVKNWNNFMSLDWSADGKGFFISSNPTGRLDTVLYVDLAGNATPLRREKFSGRLGDSFAQRKVRSYSGADDGVQCLDGGKFLRLI